MIIEQQNILELKIKLGSCRMECDALAKKLEGEKDPAVIKNLSVKLRQAKNEVSLLSRYIENIEKLYHIAQNGDVLKQRVEVPDEEIEKMCNQMQEEFSSKDYNSSVFGE